MSGILTDKTVRQFVTQIGDEHYLMTASVIAASAAQAAALGEACLQLSLDYQVDTLDWPEVSTRIGQMAHLKETLLEWCNQDIHLPLPLAPEAGNGSAINHRGLFDYLLEVGGLSVQAVKLLQEFRPLAYVQVADDLEITMNLLIGQAQAALRLLNSRLSQQPEPALAQEYEPARLKLAEQLAPLTRIKSDG
jgi:hypothetical protein